MKTLEITKEIFPNSIVEMEGEDIVIDNLLRIHPTTMIVKTLRLPREIPAFDLLIDAENVPVVDWKKFPFLTDCLMEAVKYHAQIMAMEKLNQIQDNEFAKQMEEWI